MTTIQPTMLLINARWNNKPSFKLMPISVDCPYAEAIFDPESKTMVVVMKTPFQALRMVPKIDDNGDIQNAKVPRPGGKKHKEERKTLELPPEILVEKESDIENLVDMVAINATTFHYQDFFKVEPTPPIANVVTTDPELAKV